MFSARRFLVHPRGLQRVQAHELVCYDRERDSAPHPEPSRSSLIRGAVAPSVVVLAGPNGAGKSTVAPALLQGALVVREFVNADVIAGGLSAFDPESAAIAAGRVMLTRQLATQRVSFAFETTLASRSFAPWLRGLRASGYEIHLLFLWLPSADFALDRVAERVRAGGHDVPAETVRRRYRLGLRNFFQLYEPLLSGWVMYDSSGSRPRLIAERLLPDPPKVYDGDIWTIVRRAGESREA
jgi:predicted ABC-type ATPase